MSALLSRLAQHLDIAPDEAESALERFVERVEERLAQENEARVPGLGRFYRHEGSLAFEPSTSLALAANHRFAGLAAMTVDVPERPMPMPLPSEEHAPEPEPETIGAGAALSGDGGPPRQAKLNASGEQEEPQHEETERFWEGAGEGAHLLGTSSAPPMEDADYSVVEAGKMASDVRPPSEPVSEASHPESEPSSAKEPPTGGTKPGRNRPDVRSAKPSLAESPARSRLTWIAAAAVIVLLAIVALLLLPPSNPDSVNEQVLTQQEERPTPPAQADDEAAPDEPPPEGTDTPPAEPEPEPLPDEDPSPLRSSGSIQPDAGGFTLVVASVPQLERAEAEVERYRELGYRAGIIETAIDGNTSYRVGVGQFFDRSEAMAAWTNLPDDLPEGTWLLHIGSGI